MGVDGRIGNALLAEFALGCLTAADVAFGKICAQYVGNAQVQLVVDKAQSLAHILVGGGLAYTENPCQLSQSAIRLYGVVCHLLYSVDDVVFHLSSLPYLMHELSNYAKLSRKWLF